MYEGGVRGAALIWSPLLPSGVVSQEFIHMSDWLPTFYSAAGQFSALKQDGHFVPNAENMGDLKSI